MFEVDHDRSGGPRLSAVNVRLDLSATTVATNEGGGARAEEDEDESKADDEDGLQVGGLGRVLVCCDIARVRSRGHGA